MTFYKSSKKEIIRLFCSLFGHKYLFLHQENLKNKMISRKYQCKRCKKFKRELKEELKFYKTIEKIEWEENNLL